jgi:hypothetical protein
MHFWTLRVEDADRDAVEGSQLRVEYYSAPAQDEDRAGDALRGDQDCRLADCVQVF